MLNHVQGQVWKRVWIFEARSESGCGKLHFLVWNWVWIWRCGRHTPAKNSKEYPPPPRVALTLHNFYFTKITDFVVRRYAKVKRFSLITGSNNIAYFSWFQLVTHPFFRSGDVRGLKKFNPGPVSVKSLAPFFSLYSVTERFLLFIISGTL